MLKDNVKIWIQNNAKMFPEGQVLTIQKKLENLSEDKFLACSTLDYKDPTTMQ